MVNFGRFAEETGVPTSSLVSSRLCALPVPTGGIRYWPQVCPEAAFLPLLWLPPHLAGRKRYLIGDDGLAHSVSPTEAASEDAAGREVLEESEEGWAVRVALELTAAGFYDAESATFLDVMALVGIDIDTSSGIDRIRAWLDGGGDDDLDLLATGLELEGHLKSTAEPDWALNEVLMDGANLVNCAYAAGTESLVETLSELKDALGAGTASVSDARTLIETVCLGAASWLEDIPLEETPGEEAMSEGDWWVELGAETHELSDDLEALVADRLELALGRLTDIYEATRPLADRYLAAAGRAGADGDAAAGESGETDGGASPAATGAPGASQP